jgi:hypothetical protein
LVLTASAIRSLKPKERRYEVRDALLGLVLIIQPTGGKSVAVRTRVRNRLAKITLGRVAPDWMRRKASEDPIIGDDLTVWDARLLAATTIHQVLRGTFDPQQAERERRRKKR